MEGGDVTVETLFSDDPFVVADEICNRKESMLQACRNVAALQWAGEYCGDKHDHWDQACAMEDDLTHYQIIDDDGDVMAEMRVLTYNEAKEEAREYIAEIYADMVALARDDAEVASRLIGITEEDYIRNTLIEYEANSGGFGDLLSPYDSTEHEVIVDDPEHTGTFFVYVTDEYC